MDRREFIKTVSLAGGCILLQACSRANGSQSADGSWRPAYALLEEEGRLQERIEQAYAITKSCALCPRGCGINRHEGQRGFCRGPKNAVVYSHHPHFGEELPLVGRSGSGTIFFSNCNLRCVFCQNWPIAHAGRGREISDEQLADRMLDLQRMGCHNINVVTPTHVMPNILGAVRIALHKGLRLPLCYNTSGYERLEMIRLLDGIVDIYLPDLKFMDGHQAERYNDASAADYPDRAQAAIVEMHRQVGDLVVDERGIALRGLMVRHLVMPNRIAGTQAFVGWVAANLSKNTYVNIMSQYRVEHKAFEYPAIGRAITPQEYVEAIDWARGAGLTNLDGRSLSQYQVFRRRLG